MVLAFSAILLISLHVAGAFYHSRGGDAVLWRMLPQAHAPHAPGESVQNAGIIWTTAQLARVVALLGTSCGGACAQTDEIQVYNAEIAAPSVVNLTLHDNHTPSGRAAPAFPGGIVPNDTLNGVPEWAYGVTDWFEAGLYLPLYSVASNLGAVLNGFKLRTLFVSPDASDRSFFYGMNFEFSYNARHWDPNRYTSEIRPILGWRSGPLDLIFNPIFDNTWRGVSRLDFRPQPGSPGISRRNGRSRRRSMTILVHSRIRFRKPADPSTVRGGGLERRAGQRRRRNRLRPEPATDRLALKLILSKDLN